MRLHRSIPASIVVVALFLAPSASAAPVDAVSFSGSFTTTCTMPSVPHPRSGAYSCTHGTKSLACTGVDTGAGAWTSACRADLLTATTRGNATNSASGMSAWTCDNGAGTGTLAYRPSAAEATFRVRVTLVVIGESVVVNGSYVQPRTGRTIVVRARFPAICSWSTTLFGFEGSITPQ